MSDTPVLRLSGISKRFGPLRANDDISFDLKRGEVIALLGENGAGKTTLMNILFGHYVADAGTVEAFGEPLPPGDPRAALDAGIGMVHQHFTLADNMTVQENIALGTQSLWRARLDRASARQRIAQLSADFGLAVDPAATVSTLSVGERQRVEILKALYRDARILILDEPTAVLTPAETDALFRTLKLLVAKGLSIIFISHKLHEVMAVSDRVLVLRAGRLVGECETASTDRKELAALMVGQEVKPAEVSPANVGAPLLVLEGVSTAPYNGAALDDVSLTLSAGEITGLAGVSGNGQAALAALIAGTQRAAGGRISVAGREVAGWSPRVALDHGVARIPEDRHAVGTIGNMSVTENVIAERYGSPRFSRMGFLDWKAARRFAEKIIADYDVKCPSPEARIRLLSGGNMQKLILGRALDPEPAVILASQPTRGLDVGAVAYVHRMLLAARERGAAVLLISEDLEEILALSDRILVMSNGRLSTPSARGERSIRELGELMAGHSGERSDAA
ncbi:MULTISPECIES: ABC transporter ATP-binding protein [unclassified Shinella]|uniref:ABC transporter ATP-binding protein n=1 Tax=unclassified Shinella TaxID=2643062 RepID=UPI00225DA604|nr:MULTISPECIES: ABC transporter ATP-binding protein [unclassified Shinella]MCO5141193.1 ABC transporter ATP-binding protein [Shinella sp.]MDC7260051.1 ABC transporter ATP-binding protein [Shinella sp. YE25]CAI0341493.1 Guanosine import ATP-binding protein NupO [Rhizobiaceae bacterium]CAK7261122.1 Guanosine import ATP-binding protein NupO [Shinella sp. WSC3-e]